MQGNGKGPPRPPGNACPNPNNPNCNPIVPIDENITIMLILAAILIIYTIWRFQINAQRA